MPGMTRVQSMGEFVRLEVADGVGTIRLDRPKMNALNVQVQEELRAAAAEATERDDVKAVVVYGGERVFAAGTDVKEMADMSATPTWSSSAASVQSAVTRGGPDPEAGRRRDHRLRARRRAASWRWRADVRFAAEDAVLGQPEILLGIIPGAGGTQRLTRLVGPSRAKDLIFTGRFVQGRRGARDRPGRPGRPGRRRSTTRRVAWAAQFAGAATYALRAAKESIDRGLEVDLETGLEIERAAVRRAVRHRGPRHRYAILRRERARQGTFEGR